MIEENFMSEEKIKKCSCKRIHCERHGKCEECIEHHSSGKERYKIPYCKRRKKITKK